MESGDIGGRGSRLGIVGFEVGAKVRVHSGVGKDVGKVVEATITVRGGVGTQVARVQITGVSD